MLPFRPHRLGDYCLLDLLGEGERAEVFLAARFPLPPEPVPLFALKRLRPRFSASHLFVERLCAEAKLAALLSHPNLVAVNDFGSSKTDFFLEMEWVDGVSLARLLSSSASAERPIDSSVALHLVRQIASALQAVHEGRDASGRPLDLVHGGVTPQNVLVSYEGEAKLADVGIAVARRTEELREGNAPTAKLAYISPEQLLRGGMDPRADLYGLGVILCELLTGRPQAPPPLDHPAILSVPGLEPLLRSLLAEDPAGRPESSAELLSLLPPIDPHQGKLLLAGMMEGLFAEQRASERTRREEALRRMREESSVEEDLLEGLALDADSAASPPERTEPTEKPAETPETGTPSTSYEGREATPVARIALLKKPIPDDPPLLPTPEVPPPPPVESPKQRPERTPSGFRVPLRPIAAGILVGAIALLVSVAFLRDGAPPSATGPAVTAVEGFVSIEGGEVDSLPPTLSGWTDERRRQVSWQHPISRFFTSEYRRHTGKEGEPFAFTLHEPRPGAVAVTWEGTIFDRHRAFRQLSEFFQLPRDVAATSTGRLFVHLYPKTYEEQNRYPLDLPEQRPPRQGVVYLPLSPKEDEESKVRLAHEIAHLLGATDKFDERGLPIHPGGFIDPTRTPLYPQETGELMTRGIPESPDRYRPFASLREVRIGVATARELGWLPKETP